MIEPTKAMDVWRKLALDVDACDLFDSIELVAKWEREYESYAIEQGPIVRVEQKPIGRATRTVYVELRPREGVSAVALLDNITHALGLDDDFGRPGTAGYDATLADGRVVIA